MFMRMEIFWQKQKSPCCRTIHVGYYSDISIVWSADDSYLPPKSSTEWPTLPQWQEQEAPAILQRDRATRYVKFKYCQLLHCCKKNAVWKACSVERPWRPSRSFELPLIDRLIIYHFLLVGCINNDSIWHRFRDITTFTVYVTGCHLEKSFIFEKRQLKSDSGAKRNMWPALHGQTWLCIFTYLQTGYATAT